MLKIKVAINSDLSLTCTDLYDSNKKLNNIKFNISIFICPYSLININAWKISI